MIRSFFSLETSRMASMDISRINCLAHVVESQCSHGDCSQSFHLYAGGAPAGHFRSNSEGRFLQLDVHIDVVEVEIVAERDQTAGRFCRLDSGHPCGFQRSSLGKCGVANQVNGLRADHQTAFGSCSAELDRLVADIDHARPALIVKVGKLHRLLRYQNGV